MDLVKFRSLIEVAETGSLTKAAQSLELSQPALSRHISILERELGTELFQRSSHGMKITKGGRIALRSARRIMREFELMKAGARHRCIDQSATAGRRPDLSTSETETGSESWQGL